MHHDYIDFLISQPEDWVGEDDFGASHCLVDLASWQWDTGAYHVPEFIGASDGFISHKLMEHFNTRHGIIVWKADGSRYLHPYDDAKDAMLMIARISRQYSEWLDA